MRVTVFLKAVRGVWKSRPPNNSKTLSSQRVIGRSTDVKTVKAIPRRARATRQELQPQLQIG